MGDCPGPEDAVGGVIVFSWGSENPKVHQHANACLLKLFRWKASAANPSNNQLSVFDVLNPVKPGWTEPGSLAENME